jgi:hypothetical protein
VCVERRRKQELLKCGGALRASIYTFRFMPSTFSLYVLYIPPLQFPLPLNPEAS